MSTTMEQELADLAGEVEAALALNDERRLAQLRGEITRRAAEHNRAAADHQDAATALITLANERAVLPFADDYEYEQAAHAEVLRRVRPGTR
jgi:hypothetical protein